MPAIKDTLILEDRISSVIRHITRAMNNYAASARIALAEVNRLKKAQDEWKTTLNQAMRAKIKDNQKIEEASKKYDEVSAALYKADKDYLRYTRQVLNAEKQLDKYNRMQQQVNNTLNQTSGTTQRAGQGYTMMKNVMANIYTVAALKAGELVSQFPKLADSMVSLNARANLVNQQFGTSLNLQEEVFKAAERSRGSYLNMMGTVSKLGILAKDAFSSPTEMIAFTETMNKMFKLSGASTQEQTSAMYQLTQAMASGRLQGDEFRSIIENAPMLAQKISQSMGIEMGALKEMSRDGVITANVIKKAVFDATDEVNAKFKSMPVTFAEAMQRLQNHLIVKAEPLIQTFSKIINSEEFLMAVDMIIGGAALIINAIAKIAQILRPIFNFTIKAFSVLFPILNSMAAAILIYYIPALTKLAFGFAKTGATAMWAGIKMAAAWLIGLGPVGWVLLAIGAVIGIFTVLINKNEKVAASFYKIVNAIDGAITKIRQWQNRKDQKMVDKLEADYQARIKERIERVENIGKDKNKANEPTAGDKILDKLKINNPLAKAMSGDAIKTKQQGAVELKEEDVKMLNELATRDFMVRYQTLSPSINFGNVTVNENADIGQMINEINSSAYEMANNSLKTGVGK